MPSPEWWKVGHGRPVGYVCCVFCRQPLEGHLDLVYPHDAPRVDGVSGNKTNLLLWHLMGHDEGKRHPLRRQSGKRRYP